MAHQFTRLIIDNIIINIIIVLQRHRVVLIVSSVRRGGGGGGGLWVVLVLKTDIQRHTLHGDDEKGYVSSRHCNVCSKSI